VTSETNGADIGALAKLSAGRSAGEQEDLEAIRGLFVKAGLPPYLSRKLLERSIENPQTYLIRLLALRLYFDKASESDPKAVDTLRDLERQIELALWPPREVSDEPFDVPVRFRRGSLTGDQKASVDSAIAMIKLTSHQLGVPDLSQTTILDIGCGTKFTQAFYGRKVPVKRYHGVDVDPELIGFLASAVKDERFSFRHIDVYNERYHHSGKPLSAETDLGIGDETFDLICLFSVFTHLVPSDFRAMLELARKHIAPTGTLIFTAFIDDTIAGDFLDRDPKQPLLLAIYREAAVREFARLTGWSIKKILLPGAQHWILCTPTDIPAAS